MWATGRSNTSMHLDLRITSSEKMVMMAVEMVVAAVPSEMVAAILPVPTLVALILAAPTLVALILAAPTLAALILAVPTRDAHLGLIA
jgi:hypothetical protein